MTENELLAYMRASKLAIVGTIGPDGPQGALVGVAVSDDFEIMFDTVRDSRKHRICRQPRRSGRRTLARGVLCRVA